MMKKGLLRRHVLEDGCGKAVDEEHHRFKSKVPKINEDNHLSYKGKTDFNNVIMFTFNNTIMKWEIRIRHSLMDVNRLEVVVKVHREEFKSVITLNGL